MLPELGEGTVPPELPRGSGDAGISVPSDCPRVW
jgi:hypothetical protein